MLIFEKLNELRKALRESKSYVKRSGVEEIVRRYFVLNAFDGALTVLGAVMGSFMVGVKNPDVIVGVGFGVCLAMGISGFWGAYMAEKAERGRALKDLETVLFTNLKDTLLDKASKIATLWIAFIDGVSPAIVAITAIIPFLLVSRLNILNFETALYSSLGLVLCMLFLLGMFLGRISRENVFWHGTKMVIIGVAISIIFLFLHITI